MAPFEQLKGKDFDGYRVRSRASPFSLLTFYEFRVLPQRQTLEFK